MTIDTSSTDALEAALIDRLLDAPIPTTSPLYSTASLLRVLFTAADGAQPRVYLGKPPNGVAFPYALLRVDTQSGIYQQRLQAQLEVQLFIKPASQRTLLSRIADQVQLAFTQFGAGHPSGGGLNVRSCIRSMLPSATVPADSEIVGLRLLFSCSIWPQFLAALIP